MKHLTTTFLTVILATLSFYAQPQGNTPVKAVDSVDLNKYAGKWYEIARYPNKFQKKCVGNTTATYVLKSREKLEVINRCLEKDGTISDAMGAGKVEDKQTNAKLEVRFAPRFLSFLPMVWADYWVIDLAPDYSYSVVGTPDRDYLWILAREPEFKDSLYQDILRRAEKQGFQPAKVVKTPQGLETGKGSVLN